jgi:exonuclease III
MPSLRMVGKGGLAMLWHTKWNSYIIPLDIVSKYFIGIQIMIKPETYIFLLQIYTPCGNHPMHVNRNCLEELENIICMYIDKGTLIVMGYYNTELKSDRITSTIPQSPRSALLLALLRKYNLQTINTLKSCRGARYSNIPYNSNRETLIDYVVLPDSYVQYVKDIHIVDDNALNVSTHRPIICTLNIEYDGRPNFSDAQTCDRKIINWHNVKQDKVNQYIHFF